MNDQPTKNCRIPITICTFDNGLPATPINTVPTPIFDEDFVFPGVRAWEDAVKDQGENLETDVEFWEGTDESPELDVVGIRSHSIFLMREGK